MTMAPQVAVYLAIVGVRNIAMAGALYDRPRLADTVTFHYVFEVVTVAAVAVALLVIGFTICFGLLARHSVLVRSMMVVSVGVSTLFAAGTIAAQILEPAQASVIASVAFAAFALEDLAISGLVYHRHPAEVGLGNVDNTADVDKPVSTAQAAADDAHQAAAEATAQAALDEHKGQADD